MNQHTHSRIRFLKLKTYFKNFIINKIGVDRDVYWTLFNQSLRLITGPLSAICIITFLTPKQQGIWYTFLSLSGMSIFAELGLTRIITRFVSHEYACVDMIDGVISGSKKDMDKLFSLIYYSLRLYCVIVIAAIIILIVTGYYIFSDDFITVSSAWIVFSVFTGLQLMGSLFQSIFQGLDKVAQIARNISLGVVSTSLINWGCLAIGLNIWAIVIGNAIGFLFMIVMLYKISPRFWNQLRVHKIQYKFSWFDKILPLQWRYAISFIGGYLSSQAYIPAIYKIEGPTAAGRFGLMSAVMYALIGLGSAWLTSKTPKLNILVAKGEDNALTRLFIKSSWRGYIVYIFGLATILAFIWVLNYFNMYNERLLSVRESGMLLLSGMATIKIGFISEYVRAYKAEPFYALSLLGCLIASLLVFFILPKYGLYTFLIVRASVEWFISLPIAIYMGYLQKRKGL